MTNNERSASGEIDIERDLINLDLNYGEVVHSPENPIGTETVHIREGLNEIGSSLPPGNRGNAETVHILGKIKLETRSPRRKATSECCHECHESHSVKSSSVPIFKRNRAGRDARQVYPSTVQLL